MCGIAGFVDSVNANGFAQALLQQMADAIAHRGPDDEGFYVATTRDGRSNIGLAHRRLAIIDLASGHQPMADHTGAIQIVFNGEIYNFQQLRAELMDLGHVFRTNSDTETIIRAYEQWSEQCLGRLRGMFAFALWDARRERLFLARDRYGKKPLYLCERGGALLFASEIKSLLVVPGVSAAVDPEAVSAYMLYRYVPAPRTMFAGVRKLMPGSFALWERGRLTEQRYFTPDDGRAGAGQQDTPDPVGDFFTKLDDAVRVRMISDVPFGAFLSGGIDSSAVVGLMSRHSSQPVKTYSVGFAEAAYSELDYARVVARQFNTDHHELTVSQGKLMDHLPALIRFRDAPVAEPSDIPIYLLACEARRTVKMVLTGEGSDEFLGGYPKHVYERYAGLYQRLPGLLRHGLIEPLVRHLPFGFRRAKTLIANLNVEDWRQRMPRWFGALSVVECSAMLQPSLPPYVADGQFQFEVAAGNSALRSILYFDQTSWLPDNLLERGDRMTMAASIEARMPFMDHELAALVSALPDHWRVRGGTTKRILRLAMRRLLPDTILNRPKVGFRVPVNEWFRGGMRDYLYDHLDGPTTRIRDYFRPQALQRILREHSGATQNHEKLLWCLLSLEIWHREYRVNS
jgi:asparagine synthase (glutamine-hydrolysing)